MERRKRTYNHDGNLPKGMHIRDPMLRLVFTLLHFDWDIFVRDVQLFTGDKDWYREAVDLDDHLDSLVCVVQEQE